jgi:hypothetical protein
MRSTLAKMLAAVSGSVVSFSTTGGRSADQARPKWLRRLPALPFGLKPEDRLGQVRRDARWIAHEALQDRGAVEPRHSRTQTGPGLKAI